jgi:predicted lactoylglutathione lyase
MKFISLEPFVPSGSDFESSKQLFLELGFHINWDAGDYIGFQRDDCKFILQKFNNKEFAENFMISVRISNAEEFWKLLNEKQLPQKFGIRIKEPTQQPYGKEVNIIDLAGVCWHFVE